MNNTTNLQKEQIKITEIHHFIPVRRAIMKKKQADRDGWWCRSMIAALWEAEEGELPVQGILGNLVMQQDPVSE